MTKAKTSPARARYTLEFKREAVRLVESGQSIAAAALTLGAVPQSLFNGVKAQRQGKLTAVDSKPVSAEQMEISRPRAELARATMERDVYEHFVRAASSAQRRHLSDDTLLVHINAIHAGTRAAYGWPRTCKTLLGQGIRVGKERVQKLMTLHGIRAKGKRRFKVTTDSNHDLPIAANVLNREFLVAEPDKVWVGDITCIATDEGWLFLAVVVDRFSGQVVGWSPRKNMTRDIVMDTLRMA